MWVLSLHCCAVGHFFCGQGDQAASLILLQLLGTTSSLGSCTSETVHGSELRLNSGPPYCLCKRDPTSSPPVPQPWRSTVPSQSYIPHTPSQALTPFLEGNSYSLSCPEGLCLEAALYSYTNPVTYWPPLTLQLLPTRHSCYRSVPAAGLGPQKTPPSPL